MRSPAGVDLLYKPEINEERIKSDHANKQAWSEPPSIVERFVKS